MLRTSSCALFFGTVILSLCSATVAKADDQQLIDDYLASRELNGAIVRPITDAYISRAFPGYSFFGVIFRRYPVAVQCPDTDDVKCTNLFFVKDGQVDFVATIPDLEFFFKSTLSPAATEQAAGDAASTWLRFSEELKQDLFFTFSDPEITYTKFDDLTRVRAQATVTAGGEGRLEVLLTLGAAGSLVSIQEKGTLRPGIRPICQATKLLDPDPIVRGMAEQDLLVMGRAAKTYMDQVRATASPELQQAIDRIWRRILKGDRYYPAGR